MTSSPETLRALYAEHAAEVMTCLRGGFGFTRADGSRGRWRVESAFEAEDVCHEAFAIVLRQMANGRFDRSRPVRPYLLRVATNLALSRARQSARELPHASAGELAPPEPPFQQDPVEVAQRQAAVQAFRDTLDTGERAVLVLAFEEGLGQHATGERLGLSRDQVYRVMQRIRRAAVGFFGPRGWGGGRDA